MPNAYEWGHNQRQWRQWPGDENRIDIRYPGARGLEPVQTPQGAVPEPLPKEEYGPPGPEIQIQEGAPTTPAEPTGPIQTPLPFELGPGFEERLPGLPGEPEGPSPQQPPTGVTPPESVVPPAPGATTTPSTETTPPAPGTTTPSAKNTIPPAPSLQQSGTLPPAPGPLPELGWPKIGELAAVPSAEDAGAALGQTAASESEPSSAATDRKQAGQAAKTAPMPKAAAPADSVKPWTDPEVWKARRTETGRPATRQAEYREPAKSTKVGLDGYCPVELVRHEQWVDGNRRWAVEYEGKTYLMSGPSQQRLFRANPERYAPALGGCDPVLAAAGAGRVAGRTDACVIYEGRLFMFRSQATLATFRQDPQRFVARLEKLGK